MWKRILSGEFLIAAAAARFCRVRLFVTPWTVACQAPLSIGFSRQQYCNGLPCPPPGNFPNPGIETMSLVAPALQADSLLLSHQGNPVFHVPGAEPPTKRSYASLALALSTFLDNFCTNVRLPLETMKGKDPHHCCPSLVHFLIYRKASKRI